MRSHLGSKGLMLVEVLIAVAVGTILLASLDSLVRLGLRTQAWVRSTNELAYQGHAALDRMADRARAMAPQPLAAPPAGTTGTWFAPVMYCLNASRQLIETTTSDSSCAGTAVVATHVTAFAAQPPPDAGPVDDPLAMLTLTLADDSSGRSFSLAARVRMGGGAL